MFGLLMGRKLIFSGIIALMVIGVIGYYYYQMNSKNNQIIQLQNKAVVQKVKINNLNTKIVTQKVHTKNKIFEMRQLQTKKQITKDINNGSKKLINTDVNSSIGSHIISI